MHLACPMTGLTWVMLLSEIPKHCAGRRKAPALYSVNGSLHEICECALVQERLFYVVLAQVLHHIDPTRLQCLPEDLQGSCLELFSPVVSKRAEAHIATYSDDLLLLMLRTSKPFRYRDKH